MKTRRDIIKIVVMSLGGIVLLSTLLAGQQRRGMGGMGGMAAGHREDMMSIHALFADHEKIDRRVTMLANGVKTITESDDPSVAARIVEHTYAMRERLEKNQPIRSWDALFAELFANASKIRMDITRTAHGVAVLESSSDPWVVKLIQAHADAVSRFVEEGMSAMHDPHEVPER